LTFHHISSPISAMAKMVQNMLGGYLDAHEEREYIQHFEHVLQDCRAMIENHQNYARIVRGIAPPILITKFDLGKEAEFRRKVIQFKYKGARQNVRWEEVPSPAEVRLDKTLVGDIVQNLLDNACKYSPARAVIYLRLRKSKHQIFLEVRDQGPGLPPETEASLFEEGYRGTSPETTGKPGLGLGLYMVRQYAQWMGGDVWAESKKGLGTTFTVRLPKEMESGI